MTITVGQYGEDFDKHLEEQFQSEPESIGVSVPGIGVVQSSIREAKKQNPDAFAESLKLSKQTGLPEDVVSRNFDELSEKQYLDGLESFLSDAPKLKQALADTNLANLAHDDVENLSLAENAFANFRESANRAFGNTVEGIGRLYDEYSQGVQSLTHEHLGFNPSVRYGKDGFEFTLDAEPSRGQATEAVIDLGKDTSERKAGYQPEYTPRNLIDNPSIENTAGLFVEQGPAALVYMILSRVNPTLTAVSFGEEVAEDRAENNGREEPNANDLLVGNLTGAVMAKLERIQADNALNGIKSTNKGVDVLKTAIAEGLVETGQEALQYSASSINTDKGFDAETMQDRMVEGFVGGSVIGGGLRGSTATAEKLVEISAKRQAEKNAKARIDYISELSKDSKLRQRSPEEYEKLIKMYGGDSELEVEPEAMQKLFQANPEFVESLSEIDIDLYTEAKRSIRDGNSVVVPISKYTAYFSEHHSSLSDHMKVNPEGVTAQEAQQAVNEILKQDAPVQSELEAGRAELKEELFGQLFNIQGNSTAEVNAEVGSLVMSNLANDAGMTPMELASAYQLDVSRYTPEALKAPKVQDGLDLMLDRLRSGDLPTEVEAKGQPVLNFLRSIGGLKDDGGELAARDLDKRQDGFGKLSQVEGLDMDTAIEKLIEAGYVESETGSFGHNELMDLIDDALNGINQFSPKNENGVVNNQLEALNDLERHIDELGIDLQSMTNQEVRDVLYGNVEAPNTDTALYQESRGSLQFGDPKNGFKLELTPNADHSTFVHEMAHYYLEVANDLSKRTGSKELQSHLEAIDKWHKSDLKSYRDELRATAKANKVDVDIDSFTDKAIKAAIDGESKDSMLNELVSVASHERFARGFEAYLREGKTPTPELAGVFARFQVWLTNIYKSIKGLNVELSDEVRSVYDRMLASQEEIDNAKEAQGYRLAVEDYTDLGISKKEAQRITDLAQKADEQARQKIASKAYEEGTRAQKKWWKEERARIHIDVAKEINEMPIYQVIGFLQKEADLRIDKQALIDEFGKDFLKRLPKGKRAIYQVEGVHPSQVAMQFGYQDYNQMMLDLVNAKPMKKLIAEETNRVMENLYGNMLNDGSLAGKAIESIHNESQSDVLEAEENALAVANKTIPTRRQLVKQAAEAEIGAMRVRDIRPYKYQQAEAKFGRRAFEAASKGDYAKALEFKRLQIANHERFKIATKKREQAEKIRARLEKYSKAGTTRNKLGKAGEEYLDAVDEILERIEFRKGTTLKAIDKRVSLNDFIKQQEENGFVIDIPNAVIEDAKNVSYKTMSFDQLVEIDLAVQQIAHLAKTKNKLIIAGKQRDFDEVKRQLLENIKGKANKPHKDFTDEEGVVSKAVSSIDAVHTKPEFMFTHMDGETEGVWWETFFKPLRQAMNREVDRQAEYALKTKEIFSVYTDKELMREKIEFAGRMITRDKLLAMALNYGNENNKNRLYFTLEKQLGLSAAQVDAELMKSMTERDWKTVQKSWNMVDEFWPEIKESERQRTGRIPEKAQAEKVTTPYGAFSGGYYPIKYDEETSFKQQVFDDKANLSDVFANNSITPTTAKGHRETRVQEVKRELKLELSVLDSHVSQVIHDLEFFDTLRSLDKLLLDDEINSSMRDVLGHQKLKLIRPFLADVGRGHSATKDYTGWFDRAAMALRRNATMVNMGFKLTTAIQQPLGMTQTFAKIGLKHSVKEAMAYWSNPVKWKSTADEVFEKSSMMRNRIKSYDREVNDVLRQAEKRSSGAGKAINEVEKYAYSHIAMLDLAVSIPTWKAAYNKALDDGNSEQDAISYAESIVAQTQSSGEIIDLAAIQRNTNTIKLFTMFYSYFSSYYNMSMNSARKSGLKWSEGQKAESIGYAMFAFTNLVVLPAILAEYLVGRGPEEDEEWMGWASEKVGVYPFMGLVFIRDAASGIFGDYGYAMTPIEGAVKTFGRAVDGVQGVIEGEDFEKNDAKNLYLSVGYFTGIPVFNRQGWITMNNVIGLANGEELDAYEALMIKEHKE